MKTETATNATAPTQTSEKVQCNVEKNGMLKKLANSFLALFKAERMEQLFFPLIGIALCIGAWAIISGSSTSYKKVDEWGDTITVTNRTGISADLRCN